MAITFLMPLGPYGWLSNISQHPIEVDGERWPSVEAYYHAMKFPGDAARRERIRAAPAPLIAKRIAAEPGAEARPDWDQEKLRVMRRALRAKFTQHPELGAQLVATGDEELVEHARRDRYWADGGDGSGLNMLGKLLMELRGELRGRRHDA